MSIMRRAMSLPTHNPVQPFARQASLTRSFWFGANLVSVLSDGHETNGALAVMEIAGVAGSEPPAHTHHHDDELIYLLDGSIEVTIGTETVRVSRNEAVFLPRGIEHSYRVRSGEFHGLLFASPAGIENAFRDIGAPAKSLRLNSESQQMPSAIDLRNVFGPRGIDFRAPGTPRASTRPNRDLLRCADIGRSRWYSGSLMTPLVTSLESRSFSVMEFDGRPGSEPPRHVHHREDELIYVLEGEVTFECGGDILEAMPGTLVFMPRGVPHHFKVQTKFARALVAMTPSGFENYFMEFSTEAKSLTHPRDDGRGHDPATLNAAQCRYSFSLAPLKDE